MLSYPPDSPDWKPLCPPLPARGHWKEPVALSLPPPPIGLSHLPCSPYTCSPYRFDGPSVSEIPLGCLCLMVCVRACVRACVYTLSLDFSQKNIRSLKKKKSLPSSSFSAPSLPPRPIPLTSPIWAPSEPYKCPSGSTDGATGPGVIPAFLKVNAFVLARSSARALLSTEGACGMGDREEQRVQVHTGPD